MWAFVARRLGLAVLTLVGMSVVIFVLLRIAPGNIVDLIFQSAGYVDPAEKRRLTHELFLDRPIAVQYLRWAGALLRGDLGMSYRYGLPAWQIIRPRIPVTVELAVLSMLIAVGIGLPTGVVSATRQNTAVDYAMRVVSLAGLSMPAFWLGMLIILLLVRFLGWIPPMTYISPGVDLRAHLLEFAFLIGGLVATETVFNLPGVARYLVEAILWRDYPIVQNLVMFIAIVVVLSNLAVDLLYARLDPRVRYA